jgi:hypothetical protein
MGTQIYFLTWRLVETMPQWVHHFHAVVITGDVKTGENGHGSSASKLIASMALQENDTPSQRLHNLRLSKEETSLQPVARQVGIKYYSSSTSSVVHFCYVTCDTARIEKHNMRSKSSAHQRMCAAGIGDRIGQTVGTW